MKERTVIRIISFSLAAALIAGVFTAKYIKFCKKYTVPTKYAFYYFKEKDNF